MNQILAAVAGKGYILFMHSIKHKIKTFIWAPVCVDCLKILS